MCLKEKKHMGEVWGRGEGKNFVWGGGGGCGGGVGHGENIKYIWYASRMKSIFVEWLTMDTNIDSSSSSQTQPACIT